MSDDYWRNVQIAAQARSNAVGNVGGISSYTVGGVPAAVSYSGDSLQRLMTTSMVPTTSITSNE